jgi:hypothetical protein
MAFCPRIWKGAVVEETGEETGSGWLDGVKHTKDGGKQSGK